MKKILFTHFKEFLNKSRGDIMFSIGRIQTSKIPNDTRDNLEKEFTLKEARLALQESDSNKSPGPDGLNAACLKHCWQ